MILQAFLVVAGMFVGFAFGWCLGREELMDNLPEMLGDTDGRPRSAWWDK